MSRLFCAPRRALSPLPVPIRQPGGRALSLIAIFAAGAALAGAQEAGTDALDPFAPGAFEAGNGAATATVEELAQAGDRAAHTEVLAGGTVTVQTTGFIPSGFDGYAAIASASGKLFAKVSVPDYGSLFVSAVFTQDFFAGVSGNGASALVAGADLDSSTYALSELHWSFDIGKKVFVRLGKQLISWGPSQVWTPVDFVNPDKENFFASQDLREGKAGLRIHIPLGKANIFLFSDFSGLVNDSGTVLDPATVVNYAARLDATVAGFELGLTGFWSPEAQAKGGLDFSGYLLGTTIYGELAAGPSYSNYEGFVTSSLGLSRSLGDLKKWTISAEGFYNSAGTELTGSALTDALMDGSVDSLYVGKWYGYAALKGTDFLVKDVDSTLYALANLTDGSYQVALLENFALPRLVPLTLLLSYLGGGPGTELTALSDGPAFQITVRTKISF